MGKRELVEELHKHEILLWVEFALFGLICIASITYFILSFMPKSTLPVYVERLSEMGIITSLISLLIIEVKINDLHSKKAELE